MRARFSVPGRLPGANEYTRACRGRGWRSGAGMKERETSKVAWHAKAARLPSFASPVRVRIAWHEPNARRDVDNVRFGAKFVLDGLVEAGVLPDDSQRWVVGIEDEFLVDPGDPRVEVEIRDDEEDGWDTRG